MKEDLLLKARTVFRGDVIFDEGKQGYHKKDETEDIEVCLTCRREKCFGEERCFRKRRDALKRGDEE